MTSEAVTTAYRPAGATDPQTGVAATGRRRQAVGILALLLLSFGSLPAAQAQILSGSYVGDGTAGRAITGLGFRPDIVIVKVDFDGQTDPTPPCSGADDCSSAVIRTSTMAGVSSKPVKGNQAYAGNLITALGPDGFTVGNDLKVNALNSCPASTTTPCTYYWVAIKADSSIKVGTYVGNGGTQSISSLAFSPEWVATIPTDTASPMMRFSVDANTYHWWSGLPLAPTINSLDATGFTVQNGCGAACNQNVNLLTYHYIAMDQTSGHVKVGTYIGNAATPRTIAGVGFQPAWVMTRGLNPATYEQVERAAAMPALESVTFRSALTKVADGNSGKHIRTLQNDGFVIGGGGGAGDLVNANGSSYAYLALGGSGGGGCCNLNVAETASTVTVTGAGSFEMRFNAATGGGIDQLYDLVEDPTKTYDLAGGVNELRTLYDFEIAPNGGAFAGVNHTPDENSVGSKVDLLEATSVRVRARQDALFEEQGAGTNILGGLKGIGDYSVYGIGRTAVRWTKIDTNTPAFVYARRQVGMTAHYTGAGPLSDYTPCYEGNPACFTSGGGGAAADWLLGVRDVASDRTDFLTILSQDWVQANTVEYYSNTAVGAQVYDQVWQQAGAGTAASQSWNLLTYFKPTNLGSGASPWLDPAVVSRGTDYRTPDSLSVTVGNPWIDASQNTGGGDDFNEAEAAYVLTLDPAVGQGLTFQIDGTAAAPRYSPFFKIRQWRSLTETPVVRLNGTLLTKDVDFKAAVKPLSRAHWASTLNWHCTMESTSACDSGNLDVGAGTAGSTSGTVTVQAGRYGNGLVFNENTDSVTAASSDFNRNIGAVEFWYQPFYDHSDGGQYVFWYEKSGSGPYDCFYFGKLATNDLVFGVIVGATNSTCTIGGTPYTATAPAATYSWRAYDWIHLKSSWNSSGLAGSRKLRIVMNGVEIATSGTFVAPPTSSTPIFGGCSLNCPGTPGANANGIIDEAYIYGGLELNAYDTNTPIAHAGLTSDAGEYLADSTKNWSLALSPALASRRGSYLYFGSDSPFRGLNVALATPGAWSTPGDLVWEFWNGTQWTTLESGYGFTDGTSDFTKNGTVYWTGDPFNWSPYSVNGGPDLYYIRLHLASGGLYATLPTESLIKTDILLFQYCGDITAAAQTFQFGPPAPTAVKLQSFSAVPADASVVLEWRTASELDNLGFHVYRSLFEAGPWTRLTASLIPGLGSSAVGQAYSYRDAGLTNGTLYFYRLEDVDASSKTTSHGPVSAVPLAGAPGGAPGSGPPASSPTAKKKGAASPSCPDWVVAAYGSLVGASASSAALSCTRHGDPEAVSLGVVSRDSRQATLELKTGGFYALHEASGKVRVFVPGFDFPQDPQAPALPFRRALVDAVVGRSVQMGGVRALDQVGFPGLVPTALGKAEMQVSRDGTVRAGRRALRDSSPQHVSIDLARLSPSVFQGETKSAVVVLTPLRYDSQRQRIVLAKRVLVKLLFTGRETGESGRGSFGRRERPQKPITGELLARFYTTSRGLYAVSFDQLFSGRGRALAASQLRLERQGQAQGFHVEPAGDLFGPGSVLYFYADTTAASTDFSSETAWELLRARDGVPMPLLSAAPAGDAVMTASTGQASFKSNRFYQPGLLEAPELWLWEGLASGMTSAKSLSLAGVNAASSRAAVLEVFLQGASESGNPVDHHMSVSVNGSLAGEAQFAGKTAYRMSLAVPVSLLHEGANELSLTNVADTGVSSYVFLDRFTVSYPEASSLTSGVFEGTWADSGTATVSGTAAALLDVTATPSWLRGYEATGGFLRFRAEAGHRYLAVSQQSLLAPRVAAVAASTLRSAANQADYLLIAPRAFLAAAELLLQRRRDQGLAARAVAFEEISDEFGHGQPSADAIQSFLAFAFQSWARPSPRYVLLLGDSSYDPRNFTGTSQPSPLPALWTKTSYLWTVSDPELAAVNGDDELPDLAIGRLPATTVAEANSLVQKLLAWEDSGQGLSGANLLVADNPDLAGDFDADIDDIAQSFLQGREVRELKLSELGGAMRPAILDAMNSGLSLASYVGHGGAAVWASENVWNSWDAPSLQAQSRQPFLITLNCLNGYFVAPSFNSLAESLLKVEGRGAIASFSPSGLSLDGPAHQYHRALMAELTSGQHQRLGDAVLAAQKAYAQTGLMPELLNVYHLLGDPAMPIR